MAHFARSLHVSNKYNDHVMHFSPASQVLLGPVYFLITYSFLLCMKVDGTFDYRFFLFSYDQEKMKANYREYISENTENNVLKISNLFLNALS